MNILKALIILNNITASFMHFIFQIYYYNKLDSIYSNFLLIENFLLAIIYLLLCIIILRHKFNTFGIGINILFWFIFIILLLIIQPEHTTLDAVGLSDIPIQWIILEIIGCITLCINCIFIINRCFEKKRIC